MVDFLNIGGQERPVKFGMNALRMFSQETGTKISDLGNLSGDMSLDFAIKLVYHGLKDGARYEKQPFPYPVDEVSDWLDEPGVMEKMMEIYIKQFAGNPQKLPESEGT